MRLRREPAYRSDAFIAGFKRLGYEVLDGSRNNVEWVPESRADLLCLWNRKAGMEERMAEAWEAKGGTVIVAENGYLQRVDKSMYAISVHGHNGSGWYPVGAEDRFSKLGFPLLPWKENGRYELVLGQRGIGSALMASPANWGEKLTVELKNRGRSVIHRPHPGNHAPRVPLSSDLALAMRCHIWASSGGVLALTLGIPVMHYAPHWICAGVDRQDQREAVLNRMAYGQWTVDEIRSGEPFARMAAENWGPATWA